MIRLIRLTLALLILSMVEVGCGDVEFRRISVENVLHYCQTATTANMVETDKDITVTCVWKK